MNVEILGQFPSPPVPNLPALAMTMAPVMPQHQQPMMTQPPVSMAMPTATAPPVMPMTPAAPAQPPTNTNFIASFPPAQISQVSFNSLVFLPLIISLISLTNTMFAQGTKADDDDFQDFQEAPKAGGDPAFSDFQGESGGSFPTTIAPQHQNRYTVVDGDSESAVLFLAF